MDISGIETGRRNYSTNAFNMTRCLLCNSSDVIEIGRVETKKIIKKYIAVYKTDFGYLFNDPTIKLMKCNACDLQFYTPSVSGDERFYSVLQKTEHYYREEKEEYKVAAQIVHKGASVLDVGCGKGEFKKFIPESDFTGLEFSPEAVKVGTANGCYILNQSVEEHAAQHPNKYDFVTAFQVLEHVRNVAEFLRSCADCVKPGGKLIIAVPSEESFLRFSTNSILNMPPHHISRWTDKALTNVAALINFNLTQMVHDTLDHLHVKAFFTAFVERSLPFKNTSSVTLINDSFLYKIRINIASLLANRMYKNCSHPAWQGKGQNVTAVFQKPH